MRLADQVAVVTGAGRGLGEQVARAFCREGAQVVLASEAASEVEAVAGDLREQGASALAVFADVREEESVRSLFRKTREHFGEVDVLLNCAGVMFVKPVAETEAQEWDNLIRINLRGTFLCSIFVRQFRPGTNRSDTRIRLGGGWNNTKVLKRLESLLT